MKQDKHILTACAKINIGLEVGKKRKDGYHEIFTLMQNISLADKIIACKSSETKVRCSSVNIPSGSDNLAYKALEALSAYTKEKITLDIDIEKMIPSQSGLGGGSSDAAAVLISANELYSLNLNKPQLASIGANVGSDVPFFIYGGSALAFGRGEKIIPLESLNCENVLIVKPQKSVSTSDAYLYLDAHSSFEPFSCDFEKAGIAINEKRFGDLNSLVKNDFEEMIFSLYPEMYLLKEKLLCLNAQYVSLSGSGSAFYALFNNDSEAQRTFGELKKDNNSVFLCSFSDSAVK